MFRFFYFLKASEGYTVDHFEVVKMHCEENDPLAKVKIYGVKISQDDNGCYAFSFKHTGHFNLRDYEKLELEVKSARLVRRS
jgi:hypothetical protein